MARYSLYAFIGFYAFAGAMHFIMPEVYFTVIPQSLGDAELLNYLAGASEILVSILAMFQRTRKIAGYGAMAMLLVFIISHVYFIQLGGCAGTLCLPEWIGWVRLILIHPLLLYWAYSIAHDKKRLL